MLAFVFPPIDPIAISVGPLAIRWYALAYLAGFLFGWRYCFYLARQNAAGVAGTAYEKDYDDFLTWAVIGTVLGGRIGYVLFYQTDYYLSNPLEIFKIWHGGMSFHGGMLGVIAAAWQFTRYRKLNFLSFTDVLACVVPIGLFFGRIANFVNGELFGRVTDVPWGVIFPRGGDLPRHPSQLYEAGLEGLLLGILIFFLSRQPKFRSRPGFLSGCFLFTYGVFRFVAELMREPDAQLGYFLGGVTMGQILCFPMMLFGLYLVLRSDRRTLGRSA